MEKHLEELVNFVKTSAESSKDFVLEQAPLVIQEFLAWHFYSSVFFMCFGVVLLLLSVMLFRNIWYFSKQEEEELTVLNGFLSFVTFLIGIIVFSTNTYECIKVSVAPRIVLLEKVGDIIKSR